MADASDVYAILYQNLIDAGCSKQEIIVCIDFARNGKWKKLLPILAEHKKRLLEQIHTSEKQIDCLDFLIYQLNKNYI